MEEAEKLEDETSDLYFQVFLLLEWYNEDYATGGSSVLGVFYTREAAEDHINNYYFGDVSKKDDVWVYPETPGEDRYIYIEPHVVMT